MVIPGVVEKDVNKFFRGIHGHDRHEEGDCARGIDGYRFDHAGGTRFQINGSVNVQALPPAGPFKGDPCILGRPTAGRPHFMCRMRGVSENHSFINIEIVEEIFIYPYALRIRKSAGLMTRKLSVTESQKAAQFFGTSWRKKCRTDPQKSL